MEIAVMILFATLFLAFANGANDNFKGVATLYGSRTLSKRAALIWATVTTLAGSLTAAWFATELAKLFSGKGLVPDTLVGEPAFMLAVLMGAAITVFVAARLGIPISTTHGLVGALVGAGLVATAGQIHGEALIGSYLVPLLASPLIALVLAYALYRLFSSARRAMGIGKQSCICIGERQPVPLPAGMDGTVGISALSAAMPELIIDDAENCALRKVEVYQGRMIGLSVQQLVEGLHILSSGAVSFARGLNDTPKIVGIAMAASFLELPMLTFLAAITMAIGGLLGSLRIADTMSDNITEIQHGRGLVANLVTSFLVLFASKWGVPVSTTHVSCGAIFGIGVGQSNSSSGSSATNWGVVRSIVLAWVATLPLAALFAGLIYLIAV